MENTTLITALYNIQREENGDGRKWSDYLEWFKETLQIPIPMIIFIEEDDSLTEFIKKYRIPNVKTNIIYQPLFRLPYAYYYNSFTEILNSESYKSKIRDLNRVECILPFYNIIQYSKFKWLETIVNENPFQSEYFFWIDAGISRFIPTELYTKIKSLLQLPSNQLVIQHNHLLHSYPINEDYLWDSQCLMCGTMFGGDKDAIINMARVIDKELDEQVPRRWINNEQILLAYIYKNNPEWFHLVYNDTSKHLCLFEKIFI